MDNSEVHYLAYDPDAIWREMLIAYAEAGGDVLYPGDEREMLLRGVQSIVTQVFAAVDVALRMDTLRYTGQCDDAACDRPQDDGGRDEIAVWFAANRRGERAVHRERRSAVKQHIDDG